MDKLPKGMKYRSLTGQCPAKLCVCPAGFVFYRSDRQIFIIQKSKMLCNNHINQESPKMKISYKLDIWINVRKVILTLLRLKFIAMHFKFH